MKDEEDEDRACDRCPNWKLDEGSEQFLEDASPVSAHALQNEAGRGSLCGARCLGNSGATRGTIAAAVTFEDFRQWALERSTRAARRWEDPYDDEMQVLLGQDDYGATHIVAVPPFFSIQERGHVSWLANSLPGPGQQR